METRHHYHRQQQQQHPYLQQSVPPHGPQHQEVISPAGGDRDRLPQWSVAETRELLAIRAELDQNFMETKRNKLLWEVISARMREKGFLRTPDQCKCKWKNLVTRYKGSEAMDAADTGRQFPFQEEMRRIFSDRMERLLRFDEAKIKEGQHPQQLQVWSEEEEEDQDHPSTTPEGWEEVQESAIKRKRKGAAGGGGAGSSSAAPRGRRGSRVSSSSRDSHRSVEEVRNALREFLDWQMQAEVRWLQESEAREAERRAAEAEWRRAMEALAEERAAMYRMWREREDERRAREEARAERRHQLVVALLTKLANQGM